MPFMYGQVVRFDDFTDREEERERLKRNFRSSLNTVLISPRRWGKSSLVSQVCDDLVASDKNIRACVVDLFNVDTEEAFYQKLAEAVVAASSTKFEERAKLVARFFRQIIPVIGFSPTPSEQIELRMDWKEVKKNPDEILDLAERIAVEKKLRFVVCIDEFQNIAQFEDPLRFQKKLRAHWQLHQSVAYCLYGSKRHMMLDVFTSPKMPFYKFGDLVLLEKIKEADWVGFICARFKKTGKKIAAGVAAEIARAAENHPYYVQQLAQLTWLRTDREATSETVEAALKGLINQLDLLFQNVTDALTSPQRNFLHALLNGVTAFNAKENLDKYQYGTSGNVRRIKEALLTKEIVDMPRASEINILDPIYSHWLRRVYFKS